MDLMPPDFFWDVMTAMSIAVVIYIAWVAIRYDPRSAAGRPSRRKLRRYLNRTRRLPEEGATQ